MSERRKFVSARCQQRVRVGDTADTELRLCADPDCSGSIVLWYGFTRRCVAQSLDAVRFSFTDQRRYFSLDPIASWSSALLYLLAYGRNLAVPLTTMDRWFDPHPVPDPRLLVLR